MSLARIGVRGAYLTGLSLGVRQVISLLTTLYVAHHLLPADIGLFTIVMIVIGLAQIVGDLGIATGIVKSQQTDAALLNTCFWVAAGIGLFLSALVLLLAPVAGWFYNNNAMVPFLRMSTFGLLLNFLTPIPMALLQQKLAYREISLAQSVGSVAGAFTAILLVYFGYGIWGLVFQPIAGNVVILLIILRVAKWFPGFQFKLASASDVLRMGTHLLGAGVAGYVRNTFDSMIIAKALTTKDLGIYGMAQTVLYAPMHLIASTVSRVLFPLLAKIQDDKDRMRDAVLAVSARTALLIFPLYFGLVIVANDFVLDTFGPNWEKLVSLLRIMSMAFLIQSVGNISGPLMLALGKSRLVFRFGIGGAVLYLAVLLMLLPYGLTAIAVGYTLTNSLVSIVTLVFALRFANIKISAYLRVLGRPFLYTIAMSSVVSGVKYVPFTNQLLHFVIMVLSGAVMYVALVFLFEKAVVRSIFLAIKGPTPSGAEYI